MLQLWHVGRVSHRSISTERSPSRRAPSPQKSCKPAAAQQPYPVREHEFSEIPGVVEAYRRARNAKRSGSMASDHGRMAICSTSSSRTARQTDGPIMAARSKTGRVSCWNDGRSRRGLGPGRWRLSEKSNSAALHRQRNFTWRAPSASGGRRDAVASAAFIATRPARPLPSPRALNEPKPRPFTPKGPKATSIIQAPTPEPAPAAAIQRVFKTCRRSRNTKNRTFAIL